MPLYFSVLMKLLQKHLHEQMKKNPIGLEKGSRSIK